MAASSSKRRSRPSVIPSGPPPSHEWEKDDEELELEERLFGRSRKRTKAGSSKGAIQGEERNELADVDDDELFTIDAPLAAEMPSDLEDDEEDVRPMEHGDEEDDGEASDSASEDDEESEDEGLEFEAGDQEEDEIDYEQEQGYEEDGPNAPSIYVPPEVVDIPNRSDLADGDEGNAHTQGKQRKAIWHDPADDLVTVNLEDDRRLRKLARGVNGSVVKGKEFQKRLRQQFEALHPRPEWADHRSHAGIASLSSLLSSAKSFIDSTGGGPGGKSKSKKGKSRTALPPGELDVQRLRNANQQNPTTGKRDAVDAGDGVVDFAWHPSERVGVLAVAGGDRRVRFFNIDGHTNPTLMTLHIPSLPLTRTTFHPSGSSILFTGSRPFYYTYDLASQRCLRSPRNLFGSLQTPTSPNSLTRHAFSPDGSLLAVAGRRGAVSVLDWNTSGVGAVIADLRSGRGGAVCGLVWSLDGKELSVLGGRDGAEVEVWNVGERKVVRKWSDDRAFGGVMMVQSRSGEYTAIGSSTGIVNVYSSSSLNGNSFDIRPEPVKSLEHLTTPISSLAFNPSSELLVTGSKSKKNQLKMYHLPTLTAYQNFPTATMPLKRVSSVGFSAGGEYFASGNQNGVVLLWRLKHYADV